MAKNEKLYAIKSSDRMKWLKFPTTFDGVDSEKLRCHKILTLVFWALKSENGINVK